MFLQSLRLQLSCGWPWTIPALSALNELHFNAPVTIFCGENGTGKSTLLEAIARKSGRIALGRADAAHDQTLSHLDPLCDHLHLRWRTQSARGFFLRAEDVFAYTQRLQVLAADLQAQADIYSEELENYDNENQPRDEAIKRARGSLLGQKRELTHRYGENPDARSHGETFLHLFQERLSPRGLYLLDEPEAALSPLRQLALLGLLKSAINDGSQFIIATHSPFLMAFPEAQLLDFNQLPPAPIDYDEVESIKLWRAFLRDPAAFTHRL